MITQGAEVSGRCADCAGTTTCDVGQFVDHGTLSWTVEGRCADCSSAWCEQGEGPVTPESIRQALLQEHGPTRLRLTGDAPSLVPVLRSLRALHGLSLGEARVAATRLAATGFVGTLVEVEILALHLRSRAVAVAVEPGEQPTTADRRERSEGDSATTPLAALPTSSRRTGRN